MAPMIRAAVVGSAFALGLAVAGVPAWAADPVIARVDGVEIHRSALESLVEEMPEVAQNLTDPQVYDRAIEHLVSAQLLLSEARRLKLDQDAEVRTQVKQVEDLLIRRAYLRRHIEKQITDAALKTHYDKLIKDSAPIEQVRARHILVETEDEAKTVTAEIKGGADFAAVAKTRSRDSSKDRGGDLGYLALDSLVESFADAVRLLQPGQMTAEPVKSPFGWHVIRLEDRKKDYPSFEDVKEKVRAHLAEDLALQTIGGLRAKANVQKFRADGSPAPAVVPAPAGGTPKTDR